MIHLLVTKVSKKYVKEYKEVSVVQWELKSSESREKKEYPVNVWYLMCVIVSVLLENDGPAAAAGSAGTTNDGVLMVLLLPLGIGPYSTEGAVLLPAQVCDAY